MSSQHGRNPAGLSLGGRLGFLFRDSALYGGAAAVSKAFALITFPLLSRHFSVADYGSLDYFVVLAGVVTITVIFGQDSAVARYFYEHEEEEERRQIISQSLLFQLGGLALLLPLMWLGADIIVDLLIDAPDATALLRITLAQLPFLLLINFSQNLLKWTFDRTKFLVLSLGFTIVQTLGLVGAVRILDVSISGVLLVSLATTTIFGLLGLFFVRRWLLIPRDFHFLRAMLPFAAPYGVICILGAFSPTLERTLTVQLIDAQSLGLYAAGTKAAMLIGMLVTAFQTAWGPFSLSIYKQADAGVTYNRVLRHFAIAMCCSVFGLALIAHPLIEALASDRFLGAAVVVFPLAMALAIQATGWITEIGIGIAKRSHLSLYSYGASLIVTLGATMALAPIVGLAGVAAGVLLGSIAKALLSSWLAQSVYPMPWDTRPVIVLFATSLVIGSAAMFVQNIWGGWGYSAIMAAGMVTVAVGGWLMVLTPDDRRSILDLLSAVSRRYRQREVR